MKLRKINLYLRIWGIIKYKQVRQLLSLKKSREYTPFIILCAPRTGSTLLHTYLNSHPNIHSYGESWKGKARKRSISADEFVSKTIFTAFSSNVKAVGIKVFYQDSSDGSLVEIVKKCFDTPNLKIIHLIRKNSRAVYRSLKTAEITGIWSSTGQSPGIGEKIAIEQGELENFNKHYLGEIEYYTNNLKSRNTYTLYYENLTSDSKTELDGILNFLGVPRRVLYTLLKKQK